jgi:hypothetical protein
LPARCSIVLYYIFSPQRTTTEEQTFFAGSPSSWHLPVFNAAILVMSYLLYLKMLHVGCTDMPQSCDNIFYLHGNFTAVGNRVISSVIPLLCTIVTPLVTPFLYYMQSFSVPFLPLITYCRFVGNTN